MLTILHKQGLLPTMTYMRSSIHRSNRHNIKDNKTGLRTERLRIDIKRQCIWAIIRSEKN